jgi:SAM-dependent methyltransferase
MVAQAALATKAEQASCPTCDGEGFVCVAEGVRDHEYGAPGSWCWLRCTGCSLIRLDPMPTDAELARAYPPDYHAHVAANSRLTRALQAASDWLAARTLAAQLPENGAILDVGCGAGRLLEAVGRRGDHRLFGVETDSEAAASARSRGVEVFVGELEAAPFAEASLDAIVLRHVLEHVRDPIETLRSALRLLRPGGLLLGELPNHRSLDAWLFGSCWGGGHAPRHLWHFEPDSLCGSLSSSGFESIEVHPALHTGHWALSIQNGLRRGRSDLVGLRSGRASYYPALLLLTLPINALQWAGTRTGIMRFRAQRPR